MENQTLKQAMEMLADGTDISHAPETAEQKEWVANKVKEWEKTPAVLAHCPTCGKRLCWSWETDCLYVVTPESTVPCTYTGNAYRCVCGAVLEKGQLAKIDWERPENCVPGHVHLYL